MKSTAFVAQTILLLGFSSLTYAACAQQTAPGFALHDGDRVTFYGDSITEQRQYTEDVEEYVLTRVSNMEGELSQCRCGWRQSQRRMAQGPSICVSIAMCLPGARMSLPSCWA